MPRAAKQKPYQCIYCGCKKVKKVPGKCPLCGLWLTGKITGKTTIRTLADRATRNGVRLQFTAVPIKKKRT